MSGCCSFIRSLSTAFILSCVILLKYSARLNQNLFWYPCQHKASNSYTPLVFTFGIERIIVSADLVLNLFDFTNSQPSLIFLDTLAVSIKTLNGSTNPSMGVPVRCRWRIQTGWWSPRSFLASFEAFFSDSREVLLIVLIYLSSFTYLAYSSSGTPNRLAIATCDLVSFTVLRPC